MKKQDIQKWVEALRSGKYLQTTSALQDKQGYCCLGVACELFIPKIDQNLNSDMTIRGSVPEQQRNAPLWLQTIDDVFYAKSGIFLTNLNDANHLTFNEIADVLEAVFILKVLDV